MKPQSRLSRLGGVALTYLAIAALLGAMIVTGILQPGPAKPGIRIGYFDGQAIYEFEDGSTVLVREQP